MVSGRFPFASGCQQSEWIWLGCTVIADDQPVSNSNGIPVTRQCFLKVADCEILDTWYATGLRGTGSNDVLVHNVFVPAERTFSFQDPDLVKRVAPLHIFPFLFLYKLPAVALGIARHALDALVLSAPNRQARRYTVGDQLEPPKALSDETFVQEAVGRAETMLASARAYLFDTLTDVWAAILDGNQPSPWHIALLTTAQAHIGGTCLDVVQLVCKAAGGSAVYQKGPYDRCLRDMFTMNQHAVGSLRTYEMAGRAILGAPPVRWLF